MKIHKTAVIEKGAQIGKNNEIGPYVVVEDSVKKARRSHKCRPQMPGGSQRIDTGRQLLRGLQGAG